MRKTWADRLMFWLFTGLLVASYVDTTVRADDATGMSHRAITIAEPLENRLAYHLTDTGHFALEAEGQDIADLRRDSLNRKISTNPMAAH